MDNLFSGVLIMAGIAICLGVSVWVGIVERREEKCKEKHLADDAMFQRDRKYRLYVDQLKTQTTSTNFPAVRAETERQVGSQVSDSEYDAAVAYCNRKYKLDKYPRSDYYTAMLLSEQIKADRFSTASRSCEPFFRLNQAEQPKEEKVG